MRSAPGDGVRPNRRGVQSRERVLDAAERVMASEGFDAATVARMVEESGVPLSSVYHYYGSKDGVLLAVMERGAERFFADLPEHSERVGTPAEHLRTVVANAAAALERHPDFLRLLIVFALQPPSAGGGEVAAVVRQVRNTALKRLRGQLALAFSADPRSRTTEQLARFALASIDGAFVAVRADPTIKLMNVLDPLPDALVALDALYQRARLARGAESAGKPSRVRAQGGLSP
jgi:AcrR family transcriptional regulator